MTPPLGVSTWVWTSPLDNRTLVELAGKAAALGFDILELPVENPGDWSPAFARKLLQENGLKATVCLVMPPGRELVAASAEVVRETQDYLKHVVDVASEVGSAVIAGPAYTSVGRTWRITDRDGLYAELRDNLMPVLDHAEQAGVTVAVEPLNRYETSLLNTVGQTLEAIGDLPSCGVGLDTYHQNIEEQDIAAAIRSAAGRIAHVQVCANDRGAPGADHLDWPSILTALRESAYEGPLCIESFTPDNEVIATAASIWRPLASSPDALAGDGLAFLTKLLRS